MSSMGPVLVLVHGARHGPWIWDRLTSELAEFDVVTVDLPSSGPDSAHLGGLDEDIAAVRAAV